MGYEVEKLAAENAVVGEGPVWDVESQTLYWIDIQGGKIWNYDPSSGENNLLHTGYNVAGATRNKRGGLAFGAAHRAQASTEGVARFAPLACAGPLLSAELSALGKAFSFGIPMMTTLGFSKAMLMADRSSSTMSL